MSRRREVEDFDDEFDDRFEGDAEDDTDADEALAGEESDPEDEYAAAFEDAWNESLDYDDEDEHARGEVAPEEAARRRSRREADASAGEPPIILPPRVDPSRGGHARDDGLPPLGDLARAIDAGPRYDPDAEDGLLHAGPRALETLVRAALSRADPSEIHDIYWRTLPQLRDAARTLAARQTGWRQTALQRLVNPWRMSETEVCLRLALYLVENDMVTSAVQVRLPTEDVTRFRHAMFNIHEFMKAKGGRLVQGQRPPYGTYAIRDARQAVDVCPEVSDGLGSLIADVGPGSRLVVYGSAGPTRDTSGGIEHKTLRMALGKALTSRGPSPNDLVAVALPRSARMRRLAEEVMTLPRVAAAGISIITVGRANQIDGVPLLGGFRPVGLNVE